MRGPSQTSLPLVQQAVRAQIGEVAEEPGRWCHAGLHVECGTTALGAFELQVGQLEVKSETGR